MVGRLADDDGHFAFPVDLVASRRNANGLARADDGGGCFQEEIGIPAFIIGATLPEAGHTLRSGRRRGGSRAARGHLGGMLVVVHGGVHHRRRHHRRERSHFVQIQHVGGSSAARLCGNGGDGSDDEVPNSAVIARDQISHVPRRGSSGTPKGGGRGVEIDDDGVIEHRADEYPTLRVERADLERPHIRACGERHRAVAQRRAKKKADCRAGELFHSCSPRRKGQLVVLEAYPLLRWRGNATHRVHFSLLWPSWQDAPRRRI